MVTSIVEVVVTSPSPLGGRLEEGNNDDKYPSRSVLLEVVVEVSVGVDEGWSESVVFPISRFMCLGK